MFLIAFLVLLGVELLYFRIADKYNIIDKPNERSSHSSITLRGGGIIFPFSILVYGIMAYFSLATDYLCFTIGLVTIATISFIDDVKTLSSKIRILVHLVAVTLLFFCTNVFALDWWWIVLGYILVIGIINAYNFMDGINGITGAYSLSVLIPLYVLNEYYFFVGSDFIIYAILGVIVFLIFNFRKKAKCFAGDVGSVSMAFIILFLLTKLIIASQDFTFILFLAVYGVDSVLTIAHRLFKKENIFKPHRSHLYQYLSNEIKLPHLLVSTIYTVVQALISVWVIVTYNTKQSWQPIAILIGLGVLYIIFKSLILKGKIKPIA